MNDLIQLSNLNKIFVNEKNVNVLKKINYKFKKGKIYSIMGPSGSGKSTLLNLLSLIDRPTSGSITIENNYRNTNTQKQEAQFGLGILILLIHTGRCEETYVIFYRNKC